MFIAYWRRLNENFDWRFILVLFSVYFGVKGMMSTLTSLAFQPYMRDKMGVTSAARYQSLYTVSKLPWSLKPAMGMLSDLLPVAHYHKRFYLLAAGACGAAACAVLAAAPVVKFGAGTTAAMLMFLTSMEVAAVDILTQGVYSAKMVAKPETGGDLVSAVWAFVMSGGLLSAGMVAGLSRASNPSVFFWASLPLAVQVLVPVASNWLGELRVASGFRKDKARVHWPYFVLGTAMAAASLGLGATSLWTSPLVQAIYAVSASVGLCTASLWLLPRTIARAEVYMFLTVVMYLNVRGAMDVFYTGNEVCLPGGPHFSLPFYLSYTGMIGRVAGLGGIVLFQMFLSRTWFRRAFWTTTVLQVCAALIDITIVMRWNKRIGISDKAFYIVGDAMLEDVVAMLDFMPMIVLTGKLCPPGMEATVYALLAGFQNFGSAVSSSMGALAIDLTGIRTPKDAPCNFDNLIWLVVTSHVVLPLLTIPLTFVLIPNARMTDDLLGDLGTPAVGEGEDTGGDRDLGEGADWGGADAVWATSAPAAGSPVAINQDYNGGHDVGHGGGSA